MSEQRHIKHPFGAVINEDSKILILGSVPSVKSVEYNFYYMHKDNRFWRVLSRLFDTDLYNASIEDKTKFLLKNHIALYDAVEECDIVGSSDNKIYNIVPSDILGFLKVSKISRIFCVGNASFGVVTKHFPNLADIVQKLPSTSPANAKYSLDDLVDEWRVILNYLG